MRIFCLQILQIVLETIGRLDYPQSIVDIPNRGQLLTISSEDSLFTTHMQVNKIKRITLSKEKAKQKPDADTYVIRFFNEGGKIALSCMLMWDPTQGVGNYLGDTVRRFEELKVKYGETFEL